MPEMTPRQRWLAIFNLQQPDRIPTDYWGTAEVTARLLKDLSCATEEELSEKLHIDRPRGFGPKCKLGCHPDDPKADIWGVRYQITDYGTGTYEETLHSPLANMQSVAEIDRFRWPSADDYDFTNMAREIAGDDGYRIRRAAGYEPFLLYCKLRGMEQAYEDLLVNPEIADAVLTHIFDFHYELNRRTYETGKGKIDLTYIAEDLAGQHGPLFSLDVYRKYLLPRQKKMADLARSYGIHIFYHTDGAAGPFLPDLVNVLGIEILNPLQWRCPSMELEGLVKNYGDKIAFHGGIDNQQTLPFGTVEEVAREVRNCAKIFKNSRWICAPCHNIQAVTPTRNIVALYQTIASIGKKTL